MKSKLLDLIFFAIILLIVVHFSIGLNELGTIGWSIIGAIFVAWIVVEFVFDLGFDWVLQKLGLASGKGPLTVTAADRGDDLLITLINEGKSNLTLVTIQGLGRKGKRISPTMYRAHGARSEKREKIGSFKALTAYKLSRGESRQIILDKRELESLGCQSLMALDSNGREWPVQWQMQAPD